MESDGEKANDVAWLADSPPHQVPSNFRYILPTSFTSSVPPLHSSRFFAHIALLVQHILTSDCSLGVPCMTERLSRATSLPLRSSHPYLPQTHSAAHRHPPRRQLSRRPSFDFRTESAVRLYLSTAWHLVASHPLKHSCILDQPRV